MLLVLLADCHPQSFFGNIVDAVVCGEPQIQFRVVFSGFLIHLESLNLDFRHLLLKNLFLCPTNKSQYYLLVMDENKKFNSGKISRQVNSSRLQFGNDEDLLHYLVELYYMHL